MSKNIIFCTKHVYVENFFYFFGMALHYILPVHLKDPYFCFFENVPIMSLDIKTWKQHFQIILKSCQTFAEHYFIKLIFSLKGTFFCFRWSKHFSMSQTNFFVQKPFDSCLIMTDWNTKKLLTLLYNVLYIHITHPIVQYNVQCTIVHTYYSWNFASKISYHTCMLSSHVWHCLVIMISILSLTSVLQFRVEWYFTLLQFSKLDTFLSISSISRVQFQKLAKISCAREPCTSGKVFNFKE